MYDEFELKTGDRVQVQYTRSNETLTGHISWDGRDDHYSFELSIRGEEYAKKQICEMLKAHIEFAWEFLRRISPEYPI